jgi:ubiquitin thioesterase protein OTUB1
MADETEQHNDEVVSTHDEAQYKLTQTQLTAIEDEIKATQPLTSQLLPIDALVAQYSSSSGGDDSTTTKHDGGFLQSANLLSQQYTHLRRIRGDGNCYYRAFLYSLSEELLRRCLLNSNTKDDGEFERIKQLVSDSLLWVCKFGYDEITVDMFYEELVDLLEFIESHVKDATTSDSSSAKERLQQASSQLHSKLNEENATSDYCTWFMRVMTAAQMKSNPDRYLPFLFADDNAMSGSLGVGGMIDIPTFCSREVEPMNKECGMVQVAALAECFGVRVAIEYMDGRVVYDKKEDGSVEKRVATHVFGESEEGGSDEASTLTLLYRPGHYDILYQSECRYI